MAGRPSRSIATMQAYGVVNYLEHFKDLWTRAMAGFLRSAEQGGVLIFAPELLAGTHYYARMVPDASGVLTEERDRYAQALLYLRVAANVLAQRRLSLRRRGEVFLAKGHSAASGPPQGG